MNTKIIHVEHFDDDLQEKFSGSFTVKRLSIKDKNVISTLRTQLNGNMHVGENGMGIDPDTNAYNHMLATLQVAIVTAPKDFSFDELYSLSYAAAIFKEVQAFQDTFLRGRKPSEDVSGARSQMQSGSHQKAPESDGHRSTSAVVSDEVQFSLEP